MKTTVKQIASVTFIALLLLVGNVKAEGTELIASSYETFETELQVEGWMINESIWNTDAINMSDYNVETDSTLEVEDWMTRNDNWNYNASIVEKSEMLLELENWMTEDNTWNTETQDIESKLTVEDWMINDKIWK
jgi:hypothetical protein